MATNGASSSTSSRSAVCRHPDQGETVSANGIRYTFTLSGADTANAYELMQVAVLPGLGPPAHMHSDYEESFTVLEGELMLYCEDQTIHATVSACVNIPRGAVHRFKNTEIFPPGF
jgi:mannose-6-phosphate isomerase-like protein (cupin superfamily)